METNFPLFPYGLGFGLGQKLPVSSKEIITTDETGYLRKVLYHVFLWLSIGKMKTIVGKIFTAVNKDDHVVSRQKNCGENTP